MAAATITNQRWGYQATGGVDATTVAAGATRLKGIVVHSVGTAGGTAVVTSVTGTVTLGVFSGGSVGLSQATMFPGGVELDGVRVTINTTGHIVNFITT